MSETESAVLALEDGTIFRGLGFGASRTVVGEALFNTSMTGYQEILTDPSYYGQIVTMTAPQIGNYGVNPTDVESNGPKVAGFVVRDLSPVVSNWRSREDLSHYLLRSEIPGLSGVDTRTITKRLRVKGALKCCLSTVDISDEKAVSRARAWTGQEGVDYVKKVTCREAYRWNAEKGGTARFTVEGINLENEQVHKKRYRVAAYDYGAKFNIFRKLLDHGFDVDVIPGDMPPEAVRERKPDAIFLSNGPGDPDPLDYAHRAVRELMKDFPVFGICMGNHIITHALGAQTFKLKFGHRGANQPVKNLESGRVSITSQNHGYAATPKELERRGAIVTEINLNDGTVEGLRHRELPVFSVQYHPEASPGPHDSDPLFEEFYRMVAKHAG